MVIDTNLLIYAHRAGEPQHRAAQAALENAANQRGGWGIPWPCVAEFWLNVTHPSSVGKPATPSEAALFMASLTDAGAKILYPNAATAATVIEIAVRLKVRGPRIFDLQIGVLALQSGVREFWTHDRGFIALPGLKIVDPLRAN